MFYKLVNAYSRHFPFPRRGLKYFLRFMKLAGIGSKTFSKKMPGNFYMHLNPLEHIQQQLFWYGHYEKEVGDLLKKIIKPGDVFIDAGANIGYFSLLVAKAEPTSTVIAFEPASNVFEKLNSHIQLNDFKNITAVNAAAGEKDETGELFLSGTDNEGMSSLKKPENYSGKSEEIKIINLDNWFKESGLRKISVIKIDVEGSELAALRGMKEIISQFHPLIITEVNPGTLSLFDIKVKDVYHFITQLNFVIFVVKKNGRLEEMTKQVNENSVNVLIVHKDEIQKYPQLFK